MANIRKIYSRAEQKLFSRLDNPLKIQDFLTFKIRHNPATDGVDCYSPRMVLKKGKAHCIEGALLAASILEFHGQNPLLMDLRSTDGDLDHVVALFYRFGSWGAISKTNHAVLRYREPVYKTTRELAMSYFHEYFLDNGRKTLREYSAPFNLNRVNRLNWRTSEKDLGQAAEILDAYKHFKILSPAQIKNLRKADKIEIQAGKLTEWKKMRRRN
ncbi:MAG: hypothetical protein P4L74_03590 [Candidatus Doudnabacteria bacterium]|nr:hypothetical protein [Candidatus Doudnabacteria bacterium]